jgi:uncharacterized protein YjbI with pentapeptide repeats
MTAADFMNSNLKEADLDWGNLYDANFRNSDLDRGEPIRRVVK